MNLLCDVHVMKLHTFCFNEEVLTSIRLNPLSTERCTGSMRQSRSYLKAGYRKLRYISCYIFVIDVTVNRKQKTNNESLTSRLNMVKMFFFLRNTSSQILKNREVKQTHTTKELWHHQCYLMWKIAPSICQSW